MNLNSMDNELKPYT